MLIPGCCVTYQTRENNAYLERKRSIKYFGINEMLHTLACEKIQMGTVVKEKLFQDDLLKRNAGGRVLEPSAVSQFPSVILPKPLFLSKHPTSSAIINICPWDWLSQHFGI